jgi:hypothetical protein
MGFYYVGFIFWLLIFISLLLILWSIWRMSWKALVSSGITFFPIGLYFFAAAENAFRLLIFLPIISFILAYFIRKRELTNE